MRLAILANFPDPALWYSNGTWYAFATNNAAGVLDQGGGYNATTNTPDFGLSNVQMATSVDFKTWNVASLAADPLPNIGEWAAQPTGGLNKSDPHTLSTTWAPSTIQRSDGRFILYYSSMVSSSKDTSIPGHPPPHCIGAAVSLTGLPTGPYNPLNQTLACPLEQGGAIDAEAIIDVDGSIYVVWKVDGNSIGNGGECGNTVSPIRPSPIMLQKMQSDAVTPAADAIQILDRTEEDGPLVEAPMLIRSDQGVYFLFYSSGCTRTPDYDVRYATSSTITGPYIRASTPLLRTGDFGLEAPGSVGIVKGPDGQWKMAFHARVSDATIGRVRAMYTSGLKLDGTIARIVS